MPTPHHDAGKRSLTRDVLGVSLLLAGVGLVAVVVRQAREVRRLEQAMAPVPGRPAIAVRAVEARSLAVRPPRVGRAVTDDIQTTDGFDPMRSAAAPRSEAARKRTDAPLARLLENPEFFQLLDRHRQATLDTRFAGLFRRLALGSEELATFKQLLAEKDNVALEVVAVSETQPEGPLSGRMMTASVHAARSKVEDAIRASLGDERYAVYRDYEQTQPQRAVVAQLEQRLSYSGAPLAPGQADALVRVLAAHAPGPAAPEVRSAAVVVGSGAPVVLERLRAETSAALVSEAALAESQAVLSVPQLAGLRAIQAEQQASLLAVRLIRESLPANDARQAEMLRLLLQ